MSYLRRTKATCGRMPKKPNETDEAPNFEDEASMTIEDQIDNLRAKISLKEKYNKALMEEVNETNQGAAAMIVDLVKQNLQLREDLEFEKNAEKFAVKKALRSYRMFYLAVQDKNVDGVIAWLDDKIFDAAKTLNEGIYLLKRMQNKIQEAEGSVAFLEMCPIPGSEPWEMEAEDNRIYLESAIETTKANRDASSMLNKKYHEILYFLKSEKGRWPYVMQTLEKTLAQLKSELASFEIMLQDAKRFRNEATVKLRLTEEEASQNRKERRHEMNKMKKSVERALLANSAKYAQMTPSRAKAPTQSNQSMMKMSEILAKCHQEIKSKQMQVQEFENRANKIVDAMRVRDLRFCPKRLESVRMVGEVLSNEMSLKEDLRELLLKHKYRLELILQAFRYTGCQLEEEFVASLQEKKEELEKADNVVKESERVRREKGAILVDLRLGMLCLDELFNETKKRPSHQPKSVDLRVLMKKTIEKVKELVQTVNDLNRNFPSNAKAQKSYASYIKYNIPSRHIRIGAREEMEGGSDSDQDVEIDSKTPNREEIKNKSERFIAQALLRRGVH